MPDLAEIGFKSDTSPLEKITKELDKAADASDRLKKSQDDLAQSSKQADKALDNTTQSTKNAASTVDQQLGPAVQRSAGFVKSFGDSFRESYQKALDDGAKSTTAMVQPLGALETAMARTSTAAANFSNTFATIGAVVSRTLPSVVATTGASIAGALIKASDDAVNLRERLEGLAGVKIGDKLAAQMGEVSRSIGVTKDALEPALESLIKFQNIHGPTNMLPPGMSQQFRDANVDAANLTRVVKTLFEEVAAGGAKNFGQATDAVNKFFQQATKNGYVTGDMLRELQSVAPKAAQAIADVFTNGRMNADQFIQQLNKAPTTLRDIVEALRRLQPAADAAFKKLIEDPKTIEQALDGIRFKWNQLQNDLGKGGDAGQSLAVQALKGLGDMLPRLSQMLQQDSRDWDAFRSATKGADESIRVFQQSVIDVTSAGISALSNFNSQGSEQIRQFNQAVIDQFGSAWNTIGSFASNVASAAQSVAQSIASMIENAQRVGQTAASMPQPAPQSIQSQSGDTSSYGGSGGGSITSWGGSGSITDGIPTNINLGDLGGGDGGGMITDGGAFAKGGQFTVGGSGGTDSQFVHFMATPGEVVTITPPGGAAPADPSLTPIATAAMGTGVSSISTPLWMTSPLVAANDDSSDNDRHPENDIAAAVRKSQIEIVGAIGDAKADTIAAIVISSDKIVAAVGSTTSAVSFSSAQSTALSSGITTLAQAIQSPIAQAFSGAAPFWMNGAPTISSVTNGTGATGNALGSWLSDNPNYQGAYITAKNQKRREEEAKQMTGDGPHLDSESMQGGRSYPSSGSGTSQNLPPAPGISPDNNGRGYNPFLPDEYQWWNQDARQDAIQDSSDFYDQFYTGRGIGGDQYGTTDPTSDFYAGDYGNNNGDYYYGGAYATGGSFVVPGGGGIDQTVAMMRVTPGETVSVDQPGSEASTRRLGGRDEARSVTINVFGATNPQDFVRSRAQIRRAMGGA